jgi:hypothetical protein
MLEDHREIARAQVAAHLRMRRQAEARMPAPEPRMSNAMLLASPFGKLPQDTGLAFHTTGRSMTLAPGTPALPPPQEPDLWMSGLAALLGLAVLLAALRSVWE